MRKPLAELGPSAEVAVYRPPNSLAWGTLRGVSKDSGQLELVGNLQQTGDQNPGRREKAVENSVSAVVHAVKNPQLGPEEEGFLFLRKGDMQEISGVTEKLV